MRLYDSDVLYDSSGTYENLAFYEDFINATLDLYADQGDEFYQEVTLRDSSGVPLDLSGYSLVGTIKKYYNTERTYHCVVSFVDEVPGRIRIQIPSTVTSTMSAERYVYEIRAYAGTQNVRVLDGQILIDRF